MSSERYELAQDELEALLERVESTIELINDNKKKVDSERHRYWISRSRSELNDARGYVHEMEQEARAAPPQYRYNKYKDSIALKKNINIYATYIYIYSAYTQCRSEMLTKVRQYREQMAKLQKQIKEMGDNINSIAQNDSTKEGSDIMSKEDKLRQQVMLGTESLERTSQSIAR